MVNKKGWLRIVEVTISVLLIVASVFVFYQAQTSTPENYISGYVNEQLNDLTDTTTVREYIFDDDDKTAQVKNIIEGKINRDDIEIYVVICNVLEPCALPESEKENSYDGNVYIYQKILSVPEIDLKNINDPVLPANFKKLKVYYWGKS